MDNNANKQLLYPPGKTSNNTNSPNIPIKIAKYSIEKIPVLEVIIKNQKDNPAVIASDLNLGEDVCILNRINKSYKTRLC